jgi:hypothetical protein
MMRITARLEGGCDLCQRLFGHFEIAAPLGEKCRDTRQKTRRQRRRRS